MRTASWRTSGRAGQPDPLAVQRPGLPVSITDRINRTRRYHYSPQGWLTRLENGNGGEYRFSYDAVGRVLAEERPDDTRHYYRYGAAGLLEEHREVGLPGSAGELTQREQRLLRRGGGSWSGAATPARNGITASTPWGGCAS